MWKILNYPMLSARIHEFKKVKNLLGPGKSIGMIGIGGLGSYGIQYAKILAAVPLSLHSEGTIKS